jgi:spermidine synthase
MAVALVSFTARAAFAGLAALLAAAGAVAATVQLAPDEGGRLVGRAAQNWSPLYRIRGGESAPLDYGAEGYRVRFRKDTAYHSVAVVDDEAERYLRFDSSFQSGMILRRPFATAFHYTDYLQLPFAYDPSARDVLYIGLGGGSAPKRAWRDFPQLNIDVVELDPVVRDVAYRWFALPRSERLRVHVDDGRRFLRRTDRRWDAIVLDAYYSDSVPFHLTTREFLESVRAHLRPGGVVAANVIGAVRGRESRLFRSFWRTYASVFPTLAVHPVGDGPLEELRNIVVLASDGALPQEDFLAQRWRDVRARSRGAPDLTRAIRARYDSQVPTNDVPLLTDDFAPTDALILVD